MVPSTKTRARRDQPPKGSRRLPPPSSVRMLEGRPDAATDEARFAILGKCPVCGALTGYLWEWKYLVLIKQFLACSALHAQNYAKILEAQYDDESAYSNPDA